MTAELLDQIEAERAHRAAVDTGAREGAKALRFVAVLATTAKAEKARLDARGGES